MNIVGRGVLAGLFLFLTSCQPKSPLTDISGDLHVLIPTPVQDSASNDGPSSREYQLSPVTLKSIQSLKEVRGGYAQFVYAPGAQAGGLVGGAPQARFVKSESNIFLPIDQLSAQMAAIYFHLQNLIDLNQLLGLREVTRIPFLVGVEVKKPTVDQNFEQNNAFYDGFSDAMLFLPNSSDDLALYLNAGVIAHEFFHSIFYKKVLGNAIKVLAPTANKKIIAEFEINKLAVAIDQISTVNLFNLTYLRGVNEGLADFWGWIYTRDINFMQQSFDSGVESRSLGLAPAEIGIYQYQESIRDQVHFAVQSGDRGNVVLLDYIYFIGTPHARFLRQMVQLESDAEVKNILISSAEKKWIGLVLNFIDALDAETKKISTLNEEKEISAAILFEFIRDRSNQSGILNQKQCELLLPYIQNATALGRLKHKRTGETHFVCDHNSEVGAYVIK